MAAAAGRGPHGHASLAPTASGRFYAGFAAQDASSLLSLLGAIPEGETLSAEDVQALRRAAALMKGATGAIQAIEMQAACGNGGGYAAARLKTVERLAMLSPAPLRRSKRPVLVELDARRMFPPKRTPLSSPRSASPSLLPQGSLCQLRTPWLPDWPKTRAQALSAAR